MLGWIKRWRQGRLMERPLPPAWEGWLTEHVPFYPELEGEVRDRFLRYLKAFVWSKHFFGAGGLELTDEHRVVIGAAAVRLVLYLDLSYYDRLTEIIVYPDTYRHPDETGAILGEAHTWGTVVLSWTAVLGGMVDPDDGHDTALHEFAHVLDIADGVFDGTPELHRFGDHRVWARVMSEAFLKLREATDHQRRTVMRDYGATNEAEFFAVASETFFEKPAQLREGAPELYDELRRFYRTDPLSTRE
jgi:Mlc titration factor MtfA (ptsG expression regulator)